jgi:zinc transport system substrate-binding protein
VTGRAARPKGRHRAFPGARFAGQAATSLHRSGSVCDVPSDSLAVVRVLPALFAFLAGAFFSTVLPGAPGAAGPPVRVVTSIPPLAMLVSELGGDRVTVHSILPPGADAHTFEPRPSDARDVAGAGLVVMLGSPVDDWLARVLEAAERASVVRLDEPGAARDDHAGHDHAGHDHGAGDDPHVWLDPVWVRERAVPALHRALAAADPEGAPRYGVAARAMVESMSDLEEDIRASFDGAKTKSFLAWHPAWERFAKRFGLYAIGNLAEGEGREPSLRAMISATRAARSAGVRAILVEPQQGAREASVVAEELGLPVLVVDPLGDAWSVDRNTYRHLMLYNARIFAQALGVERDEQEDEKDAS